MILVAGEALIDMLPAAEGSPQVFRAVPGGSPFNVALALGRLGAPVQFLCPFSNDAFGQRLFAALKDSRVDLSLAPRTDALSTLGFVTLDEATKSARYSFYTQGTAGCGLTAEDLPQAFPEAIRCVHLGSFSLAVEPFCTTAETILERMGPGRLLSMDPNIRAGLIAHEASYRERLKRLMHRAAIIKASSEDLDWLHPGGTPASFASEMLSQSAQLVVVTRGANGVLAFTREETLEVPAEPVAVVDTVGAGDTFQAALLAQLACRGRLSRQGLASVSRSEWLEILRQAARAAAITCTRAGSDPPWDTELC
jgi:fructokinase